MSKKGPSHSFDVGIATELGIEAATCYNHIWFWIDHNRIKNINLREGKYWTYQSYEEMTKYMPYLSSKQVKYAMQKLLEAGYIIKGEFNENKFDHTPWYTFPDDPNNDCEGTKKDSSKELFENENTGLIDGTNLSDRGSPNCPVRLYIEDKNQIDDDDARESAAIIQKSNKKSACKDDIHFACVKLKKDWKSEEIDKAWNAYLRYDGDVDHPLEYIESIIKKNRLVKENKQLKEKETCQQKKQKNIEINSIPKKESCNSKKISLAFDTKAHPSQISPLGQMLGIKPSSIGSKDVKTS